MSERFAILDIVALMRDANMSATYKPALLKALARICRRSGLGPITLEDLGEEFARMYWNQVVVYHLRQAASITKESEVIKLIRGISTQFKTRSFSELPLGARAEIRTKMARILTLDVLRRFHNSKVPGAAELYRWEKGQHAVFLSESSFEFIRANSSVLEIIANYYWADFLERCNRLAPKVIQKVASEGAKRGSLLQYLRLLHEDGESACFYCGAVFTENRQAVVDHVIPWNFLLEDPLWDLVLSCAPCNSAKSDWLPESVFVERLIGRNQGLMRRQLGGKASALFGADDVDKLYQAAISVEWPRFWKPATVAS